MKKYKLIKEYPGSPNLNSVAEFDSFTNDYCVGKQIIIGVKNNPEFWQLIKQAPKIGTKVEIKGTVNGCYCAEDKVGIVTSEVSKNGLMDETDYVGDLEAFNIKVSDNWICRVACTDWQEVADYEILIAVETELGNLEIKSILRKSDNEVFSVGDLVIRQGNNVPIETIELDDAWLKGVVINRETNPYGGECLDTLRKAKKPLFVTEDGVEIFEGDTYFYIVTTHNGVYPWTCQSRLGSVADKTHIPLGHIQFSKKELAKTYIDENKPKYSEKDMIQFGGYAKNYCTPNKVKEAFKTWKGKNEKN